MPNQILFHKYVAENEAPIYKKPKQQGDRQRAINRVLMGTWVGIKEVDQEHYFVTTAGPDGWIAKKHTADTMGLKMFFIDVGQGDAVLIEAGDKKVIVDGGPNENVKNYLTKWQYTYLLRNNQPVHFDTVFISHFDSDHYEGLLEIINDTRFTFGTLYHNGIARFNKKKNLRPAEYNTDLGTTVGKRQKKYLKTTFDTLDDLAALRAAGGFTSLFHAFSLAVENAHAQNRLDKIQRLDNDHGDIDLGIAGKDCRFEVLGPVCELDESGLIGYKWFSDSSHTRNGHSVILRLVYENVSILLGGDLNKKSEEYLMKKYAPENPFEVDVSKSCHHGASDFSIEFMDKIKPYATVISSGDNESYAHPRADAIGSAGKYSKGALPKVYSTELARSINSGGDVLYGMINLRSNGEQIYMAQMKEAGGGGDVWDSYTIIH